MIYGFNHNNNNNFNPNKIMSVIAGFLVILFGILLFAVGRKQFIEYSPFIQSHCEFMGFIGVFIMKSIFIFFLTMCYGILHVVIVVKIMEFLREILNK